MNKKFIKIDRKNRDGIINIDPFSVRTWQSKSDEFYKNNEIKISKNSLINLNDQLNIEDSDVNVIYSKKDKYD